jgi:hypothetical protein
MMLGQVALDRHDVAAATAHCTAAVAQASHGSRDDTPSRAMPLTCLARAQRLGGNVTAALATAESAVRSAALGPVPQPQVNARLEVVRALAALGRDRPRRRLLLKEALALIEDPGEKAEITKEFRGDL